MTDDGASLEPSAKRRHSDSYASSTSPYHQFSPAPSVDLAGHAARSGSSDSSQGRSRQSSMSSQDAGGAYHATWGATSPPTNITLTLPPPPPPATTYGVLRMSGGELIQPRVTGSLSSPQDASYMHWNLPLPAAATTTTSTTMKLSATPPGGDLSAFQAREMSDVIENIIRQQQQQQQQLATTTTTTTTAGQYSGPLALLQTDSSVSSLRHQRQYHHHHQQQQQQHGQSATNISPLLQSNCTV